MADEREPIRLGNIAFKNVDIGTGICDVELTAPFGLQTLTVKIPLIDILENAAEINLAVCKMQRVLAARARLAVRP